MGFEQLGRLQGSRPGRGKCNLVLRHAIANGRASRPHHRSGDFSGMSCELQFFRRLDHAHVIDDPRHVPEAGIIHNGLEVTADHRRHAVGLDGNGARAGECRR